MRSRRRTPGPPRSRSASGPGASTTTSTTSAAPTATSRSSRCSATSRSATTSRPRRSRSPGSSTPRCSGLDPERLWVTVHETDDEAEAIWRDTVGVPPERIQRLGDDNFWRMGDTGPCGPSSEIFWDLGPEFGAEGGPKDGGEDRYVEIWNLVFMQFDAQPDGTLVPLPKPLRRHRRGARAQPRGAPGRRLDLGHRRVPPADRGGRAGDRRHLPGLPRRRRPTSRCASSPSTPAR